MAFAGVQELPGSGVWLQETKGDAAARLGAAPGTARPLLTLLFLSFPIRQQSCGQIPDDATGDL